MHQFIVNASIQILPIVQDRHPYEWVDEAISIIQKYKVQYEIGPFATILEGTYEDVVKVINDVNEYLLSQGCPEWISSVQLQIRRRSNITTLDKTHKYQK
ncbi:MAG TPA: thiamine-binding protein [Flavisolibacter sp.]|jgi:uncharacterized protein (TIGR00106 family)|nr:thiamine-binding protein [Flavisolibacter sp.]